MTFMSKLSEIDHKLLEFGFTQRGLDNLFPFHMILDAKFRILSVGPVLTQAYNFSENDKLSDLFNIVRPFAEFSVVEINERKNDTFFIQSKENELNLKGEFLVSEGLDIMVFLAFPWIRDFRQLENLPFQAIDFPKYDSTIDFMFLLQSQKLLQRETLEQEKKIIQGNAEKKASEKQTEFLNKLFLSIDDLIIVTDPAGRIVKNNSSSNKFAGFDEAELNGRGIAEVLKN